MVGQRYTQKRFYSWSADIAYCVGLMASDGWLSRDGRHLSLTSVDLEQLDNFCKALGKDIKVATKKSGAGTWAYHVQFSDVAFYDFLLEAGITPAKSHTIGKINIPDEYYFSFLRGVFDGDGCIRGFMDVRWRNSLMFYTEFASASPVFLKFLQDTNGRLAGTSNGAIHHSRGADTLSYAKKDSMKLAVKMYYPQPLPSLSRKRRKLFNFITRHQTAIIMRNRARVVKSVNTSA
jgi:hypothetical protein